MVRSLYFLVCFAVALVQAGGGVFYVATHGNDTTGQGTQADPWATIQHALSQVPDASTILVEPGIYSGRIRLDQRFTQPVTIRSQVPYLAQLRHNDTVITCYRGEGIVLEGFDIAHDGPGAGALVMQIQDLIGEPGGAEATSRITLRNNIFHDSYNNDLLKINNGAREILVEGNLFYNQQGSDEHIDVNGVVDVCIQDNIFFNDFQGSGRPNNNDTSSFVVIKNSGGLPQNERFQVKRNIFLNWQGSTGSNFVLIGEDGQDFHEAQDVVVENNLFLGNSQQVMRAAFGVKGGMDVLFRNNTVHGDLPSLAYAMRLNREGQNPANVNIEFYNNIWSDPTGSMGATAAGQNNDFSDTPPGHTQSFSLDYNLYWNGGEPLPFDGNELINTTDDANGIEADPLLTDLLSVVLPRWDPVAETFLSGNLTLRQEFERLVGLYGRVPLESPVRDQADPTQAPVDDILGTLRGNAPDLGALEGDPCSDLDGDLDVDLDDLVLLLSRWTHGETAPFDLDGDGFVTLLDGTLLVNQIAQCSAFRGGFLQKEN